MFRWNSSGPLYCSPAHTQPDNCANPRRYSSTWNVTNKNEAVQKCLYIRDWYQSCIQFNQSHIRDLSFGEMWKKKKCIMCHSENESVYKALIVLYLRHAFVPVTDSQSGWSVFDLFAVYMWKCRKRKTEHLLHSSSLSWRSCILPAVGKKQKKNKKKIKKTFYIIAENIESVKDGTFKAPISDRYYCVVLDVYLPCTAVLL